MLIILAIYMFVCCAVWALLTAREEEKNPRLDMFAMPDTTFLSIAFKGMFWPLWLLTRFFYKLAKFKPDIW